MNGTESPGRKQNLQGEMKMKIEEAIKEFGDEYLRYYEENDIRQMCDIGREEFAFAPRSEGFDESKEFFLETDEGLVSLSEEEVDEWIKEKIAEMESRVGNQNFEDFLAWVDSRKK